MSVSIQKFNGKFYVNAIPDNTPKDVSKVTGVSVECTDEADAVKMAEQMKNVENKFNSPAASTPNVNLNSAEKQKGVGAKLDVAA